MGQVQQTTTVTTDPKELIDLGIKLGEQKALSEAQQALILQQQQHISDLMNDSKLRQDMQPLPRNSSVH